MIYGVSVLNNLGEIGREISRVHRIILNAHT